MDKLPPPPSSWYLPETDQNSSQCGDVKSDEVTTATDADEVKDPAQADKPSAVSAERSAESAGTQPEAITTDPPTCKSDLPNPTNDPPTSSTEHQAPSSPMMDLETDFPPGETTWKRWMILSHILKYFVCFHSSLWCLFIAESLDLRPPAPQRGVKRPREGSSGRKRVMTLLGSS